jgi:quaternary ammonium compound-resistance protein SugE
LAWIVLVVSGLFEAVWAVALGKSDGFSRLVPSIVFVLGLIVSMGGLAYAMRDLPTGTSYAVWVSIGVVGAVAYSMVFDGEPASLVKILLLLGLVGCVIGLKLVS